MALFNATIDKNKCLTIQIDGRFDYNAIPEFRALYERHAAKPTTFIIDMKNTTHIDSSALGMLLMLRRHAGGDNSSILIKNLSPDLRRIFKVSKLDTMFRVE